MKTSDSRAKCYGPQRHRGLLAALSQRLGKEFPRLGGPRILTLCAEMVLEVVNQQLVVKEHLKHGQVLWCAIDIRDRPHRGQRAENTQMKPIILTLHSPDDLEKYLNRKSTFVSLRLECAIRMCKEAYEQGALLSNIDLSLLLGISDSVIATQIVNYEKEQNVVIPRRTTVHDVGSGVTHKKIICRKRYLEGKTPNEVAKETWHSLESVDRYLGQYDRVRHCLKQGLNVEETAHILGCGQRLVKEYLEIDDEINKSRKKD